MSRWHALFGLPMLLLAVANPATSNSLFAQPSDGRTTDAEGVSPALEENLASPRATMTTFLEAMDAGDTADAVACLELVGAATSKGEVYALKLKDVLDRMVRIDYDTLPDDPDGKAFSLAAYQQLDRRHPDFDDADQIRITRGDDDLWRFSQATVDSLDEVWRRWADRPLVEGLSPNHTASRIDERWVESLFPSALRQTHFLLPDYQWLCLLIIIVLGFAADLLTRLVLSAVTGWWLSVFRTEEFKAKHKSLWKPVGLLTQALVWYGGTTLIGLPPMALIVLLMGVKIFAVIAGVWTAFLFIDLLSAFFAQKAARTTTKFDDLLIPLVTRSLKIFAVCVGIITCAQAFNLPIYGLLGSLGIGGIALALASQDAVSNLFGSVTVLIDRPFEIGDWVIIDGVEGSVETVGFRSTRIRTFYNSLITVPNSKLTTATVDNMGRRRYRRIKTMIGVQYDTMPEQIEAFCEGIREIIRRHPYTRKDYYHVYLNAFGASSLDILLYCFVECPDWSIELREKQRLYLDIIRLAKELGVQFAFPTRTLHMFQEEKPSGDVPCDLSDPITAGGQHGARIAGPLVAGAARPGTVEFRGPQFGEGDGE